MFKQTVSISITNSINYNFHRSTKQDSNQTEAFLSELSGRRAAAQGACSEDGPALCARDHAGGKEEGRREQRRAEQGKVEERYNPREKSRISGSL